MEVRHDFCWHFQGPQCPSTTGWWMALPPSMSAAVPSFLDANKKNNYWAYKFAYLYSSLSVTGSLEWLSLTFPRSSRSLSMGQWTTSKNTVVIFPSLNANKKNDDWAYKFACLYSSWMFNSLWKFGLTFVEIFKVLNVLINRLVNGLAPFNECCSTILFECEQENQLLSLQVCVLIFKFISFRKFWMTFINISKVLKVLIDESVNNLKEYCGNFPLFECEQEKRWLSLQVCMFIFKLNVQ